MSPTSFPTITPGEAWDSGPGTASTLMNQITGAVNALENSTAPSNYLAPTGATYETYPRAMSQGGGQPLTSGTLYLVGIALPSGLSVGHITWVSTRSVAGPTHYWFTLHDSSRVMLAATADQTSTAWLGGAKTLAVATIASGAASSFTTTYSGFHYLGIMVASSSTTPQLDPIGFGATLNGLTPILSGPTTTTGQTTVPAFPFTATAPSGGAGTFSYGYVSP